jgi:peptidoglycan/LPS O-acetylase OafA/YrhL
VLNRNGLAVNVFIIISGFVITHLILTKHEPYQTYIVRQCARLAPVYVVCMFFAASTAEAYRFAYLDLPFASDQPMRAARLAETAARPGWHWLAHLTPLHRAKPNSLLPFAGTSILAPAWSLSLEWQFYLIAPILIRSIGRGSGSLWIWTTALTLIAYAARRLFGHEYQYGSMLLLSIHFFAIGIATRFLFGMPRQSSQIGWFVAIAASLLMVLKWPAEILVWALWCVFMRLDNGGNVPFVGPVVDWARYAAATNAAVTAIGKWSYPTYLVYIPLFSVCVLWGVKTASNAAETASLKAIVRMSLAAAMIVLIWLSWLMHALLEKPVMRVVQRWAARCAGS